MGMTWTPEQRAVIDLRERNILVSAAAGSGKTAVLVERIVGMVTDAAHPIDIDQLLVVTFTKAAAGEMRERIGRAIDGLLEKNPEDEHLMRQQTDLQCPDYHHRQLLQRHSSQLFSSHRSGSGLPGGR